MVPQVWHEKVSLLGLAMLIILNAVIPAQAGISLSLLCRSLLHQGDPRLRGDDVHGRGDDVHGRGDDVHGRKYDANYFTTFHEPSG